MNRVSFLVIIFLVGTLIVKAETLHDNGPPDLTDGSEMTHWRDADRFTVSESVILGNLRFWDIQATPAAYSGSFLWEIRANSISNTPGVLLHTGSVVNPDRVATGRLVPILLWPEYVTTFELPSISLPAGSYWLVLHNGPLTNNVGRDLFWESAINLGTDPSLSDQAPFTENWQTNGALSKLAFQLFGVPEAFRPRITAVDRSAGLPRVTFTTIAAQNYRVEFKNTLLEANWTIVAGANNIPGTGSPVEVIDSDPNATNLSHRFYRVVLLPTEPSPAVLSARGSSHFGLQRPEARGPSPENSLRSRQMSSRAVH